MIITISGTPGAGDTTTTEQLSQELNYPIIEVGEIARKIAEEKNLDPEGLWEKQEKNPEKLEKFHRSLDQEQKKLAKEKENAIVNGKLSAHHLPKADLKIFLTAEIKERAKRILMREKIGREEYAEKIDEKQEYREPTEQEINKEIKKIKKRENKERKHWKEIYGVDYIKDKDQYDLLIDTTDKKPKETVETIKKQIEKIQND